MKISVLTKTKLLFAALLTLASFTVYGEITFVGKSYSTTTTGTLIIAKPEDLAENDVMIVQIFQTFTDLSLDIDQVVHFNGWVNIAQTSIPRGANCTVLLYRIATEDDVTAESFSFSINSAITSASGEIVAFSGVGIHMGYTENGASGGPFDVPPTGGFNLGVSTMIPVNYNGVKAPSVSTNTSDAAVVMFAASTGASLTTNEVNWRLIQSYDPPVTTSLSLLYSEKGEINVDGTGTGIGAAWSVQSEAGPTGEGRTTPMSPYPVGYAAMLVTLREACDDPPIAYIYNCEDNICLDEPYIFGGFTLVGTPNTEVTYTINNGPVKKATLSETSEWGDDWYYGTTAAWSSGHDDESYTLRLLDVVNEAGCGRTLDESCTGMIRYRPSANITGNNGVICSGEDAVFYLSGKPLTEVTYTLDGGNSTSVIPLDGSGTATLTVHGAENDQTLTLVSVGVTTHFCIRDLSASSTVIVKPLPQLQSVSLAYGSSAGIFDNAFAGDLTSGYRLDCMDNTTPYYYLDISELDAAGALKTDVLNPFRLTSVPEGFRDYWNGKGINENSPILGPILSGDNPMFYLTYTGDDYQLIDGYQVQSGEGVYPFRINGDYPAGTYTLSGKVEGMNGCTSREIQVEITLTQKPIIFSQPVNVARCIDETATFTVVAFGTELHYHWFRVAVSGDDIPVGSDSSTLTISPVSVDDAADYYVVVDNSWCSGVSTGIAKLAVKELIVSPAVVQSTDPVLYTAILHNGAAGFPEYIAVNFMMDSRFQNHFKVPLNTVGADKVAESTWPANSTPGIKTATVIFYDNTTGGKVQGCIPETDLEILCEDAEIEYNGVQIQATPDVNTSTVSVNLVGVISQADDGSTWPINFQAPCLKFNLYQCDPGTTGCSPTYSVIANYDENLSASNSLTGIASAAIEIPIGPGGYEQFIVEVVNEGCNVYYCDPTPAYSTLLVYIPKGDFITGGGNLVTTESFGIYEGSPGTQTNFGFHVKYNNKGTNLQGGMNIIYSHDVSGTLHNYQIKTNAMLTLGVNATDPANKLAVFTSKAALKDLTTGMDVESNLRLFVTMTDKGEPGENDKIGITLWRVNSKGKLTDLLYSSAWSGANTTEKLLAGGNLVVHSGFSFGTTDSGLKSALIDPANVQPVIKVYPNPFIDRLLFEFVSPDDTQAHIDVYDITGRLVRTVFDGTVEEGVTYNAEFIPAESSTGIYLYRLLLGDMVYTGKVICRR